MKKTILLSVSLGVLGFANPLVHEQIVGAETSQSATQEFPDKITIHQQFQVRNIRGDKSVLDKQTTTKMYIDKSKSSTFSAPDNVAHYHPVVSEVHYSPGMVVNYMAEDAVVTVKYLDESNQSIQANKVFDQATIFGGYRLNKNEFDISGYELLNSQDTNGKIKDTNWDVTLKYKNLNPLITADKLVDVVAPEKSNPENIKVAETQQVSETIPSADKNSVGESGLTPVISKAATTGVEPAPSTPSDAISHIVPATTATESVTQSNVKAPENSTKEVKGATPSKSDAKHDDKKVKVVVTSEAEKSQPIEPASESGAKLPDAEPKTQTTTQGNTVHPAAPQEKTAAKVETKNEGSSEKSSTKVEPTPAVQSETDKESSSPKPVGTPTPVEKAKPILETDKLAPKVPVEAPSKSTDKSASPKEPKRAETDLQTSEKATVQKKPKVEEPATTNAPEKLMDHQAKLPTTTTYQLHGIDNHGHLLFNKALQLTSEEALAFRSKNVEFYGYELQSTDLNTGSKTLTLHYLAKKVTFKIINVDQDGKILSKDSVELDFGQTKTYNAKLISGYRVEQPTKELKADNLIPEDVQFTYTKLPDKPESTVNDKSVAAKAEHKKQQLSSHSSKSRSGNQPKNHSQVEDTKDHSEKLPQTGESHSVVGVWSGILLLGVLIGKKVFKRLI